MNDESIPDDQRRFRSAADGASTTTATAIAGGRGVRRGRVIPSMVTDRAWKQTAGHRGAIAGRRMTHWGLILCLIAAGTTCLLAQTGAARKYRRAKLPDFNDEAAAKVFFGDVFSLLVGQRPSRLAKTPAPATAADTMTAAAATGAETTVSWRSLISATTLEDEIKSLKLDVDRVVTTPGDFAGRGHQAARVDFSLLTLLFAIIEQYDGDVRWKESAAAARYRFAHTAANLKAGGAIQVYNESKQRKQDLDELIRGARLQEATDEPLGWDALVDRSPIMQLLESRFESNLRKWTANKSEFQANRDGIRHDAELAAVLGRALVQPGMDDAEDDAYRVFAQMLERAAVGILDAVKTGDDGAARNAMAEFSRSCTDCHADYR